jgi:Ig-like domain-containing protein/SdrD B-like protein
MNTNKTFAGIVFVAFILSACNLPSTSASIPITGAIGMISPEETLVESGHIGQLVQVSGIENFYNNDAVRVTQGGVAKLDFLGNQISIRLFNDTEVHDVTADPSETVDPVVRMKLVFGGLSGEVTKNGIPAKFNIANGVNIYILGTQFLILYDPATSTTYIGNFDGTIAYNTPAQQSIQFIQAGQLYEISSTFEVNSRVINFTRADIDSLTLSTRSTLLTTLRSYLDLTPTPTPTSTPPLLPTITLTSTTIPVLIPTITPAQSVASACDQADFAGDVTVPDGTSFSPSSQFTKVWRLRNAGTCTWTTSYSLVFYTGEQMAGKSINIPSIVAPGQTVDIAVGLVAPALPGSYRGEWMLRNSSGALFGAGANGTTPIWVAINVISTVTLTPTATNTVTVSSPGAITGIAFSDNNGNGIPEASEAVPGVTVSLYDNTGNTFLGNKTTDASGRYTFASLNPGAYHVKWVVQASCGNFPQDEIVNVTAGNTQIKNLQMLIIC